jgi:hypothetical protein
MAQTWQVGIEINSKMMNNHEKNTKGEHPTAEAQKVDERKKKDDVTGQTDTTLSEMKARLKEVPHTSAGSNHDKEQYKKVHPSKRKRMEDK